MITALRRGACPSLAEPMQTGDGLLVRLLPAKPIIACDAMRHLCAAARAHGNGILEITARGNLQIRGLTPHSAPLFAQAIGPLDIADEGAIAIHTNALRGLDPNECIDPTPLSNVIRRAIDQTQLLSLLGPKTSIVVDGGGTLHLDQLAADIRIRAVRGADDVSYLVGIGGNAANASILGATLPEHTVKVVIRLLELVAAQGKTARARDLIQSEGIERIRAAIGDWLIADFTVPACNKTNPIGIHPLRDDRVALGIGLAFGHVTANVLESFIDQAEHCGTTGLGIAADGALFIFGLTFETAKQLASAAEHGDFVIRANDPRRSVFACAGAPLCASGQAPARDVANIITQAAEPLLDGSVSIHVSGCSKGCAHHAPAALTIVGTNGAYALVMNGSARDHPFATVTADALPQYLARLAKNGAQIHTSHPAKKANHG